MKIRVIITACVLVVGLSFFGCTATNNKVMLPSTAENTAPQKTESINATENINDTNNIEETNIIKTEAQQYVKVADHIVDINNTRYISNSASRMRPKDTYEALKIDSPFILTGACISSKAIFQNETLYTLSEVRVKEVFKGNIKAGDVLLFVEMGGRTTFGELEKGCNIEPKDFEAGKERLPADYKIVSGTDGFFPMNQGENVLLFACDTSGFLKDIDKPLYSILGSYDGKLFLQEDGTYKHPTPSKIDKLEFGAESLTITIEELRQSN